jgi:hypothetical protein
MFSVSQMCKLVTKGDQRGGLKFTFKVEVFPHLEILNHSHRRLVIMVNAQGQQATSLNSINAE